MPTIQVGPGSSQELQQIADTLGRSKKVVVVTGAGISTNCGIPDFRSENGLYSLIQAHYDEALKNPPWEESNTFDIDDRPKKKRKQWYYEVVAPDGKVVDVIDPDAATTQEPESQPEPEPGRSLRSRSSNDTTTSNSRSSTPGEKFSSESSLSSCPSVLSDPLEPDLQYTRPKSTEPNLFCPPQIDQGFLARQSLTPDPQSAGGNSLRYSSPLSELDSTITALQSSASSTSNSRPQSRASSLIHISRSARATAVSDRESSTTPQSSQEDSTTSTHQITFQRANSTTNSSETDQEEPTNTQSSQSSRTLPNLKGRDLFDCMVWSDSFTTSIFYMFISSLRQKVQEVPETSETHKFLRILRDGGRLVRTYSQNIDRLEEREGLTTDLSLGPGNRNRFSYKAQKEHIPDPVERHSTHYRGAEVVLLHGSLGELRCGLCSQLSDWDEADRLITTLRGIAPECPHCSSYNSRRTSANRRGLSVGRLRPNVVLYGEEHPNSTQISPLVTHDLGLGPDVLLIMGTSLRVHGLKNLVKEFAKAVHTKGGKVVFVNNTKPSESAWGDVIDYWVEWDCDAWVLDLKERRNDIWLPQGAIKEEDKKRDSITTTTKPPGKRLRPQNQRDCKVNGAYFTYKILDHLRAVTDLEGQPSSRKENWPTFSRQSNAHTQDMPPPPPPTRPQQPTKSQSKKPSKVPSSKQKFNYALAVEKIQNKKRKSHPTYDQAYLDDKENLANKVAIAWADMRKKTPSLSAAPPNLRLPFSDFGMGNDPELFKRSFLSNGSSNHFPDIGSKSSTLGGMNLTTLPPSGPQISGLPPPKPSQALPVPTTKERTPPRHSYGTRAKKTAAAPAAETPRAPLPSAESSDTIEVVDLSERPITPDSQRIKRIGSIGNLVASPEDDVVVWYDASEVME